MYSRQPSSLVSMRLHLTQGQGQLRQTFRREQCSRLLCVIVFIHVCTLPTQHICCVSCAVKDHCYVGLRMSRHLCSQLPAIHNCSRDPKLTKRACTTCACAVMHCFEGKLLFQLSLCSTGHRSCGGIVMYSCRCNFDSSTSMLQQQQQRQQQQWSQQWVEQQ